MAIMLSIEKPCADMILKGEKWLVFKDEIVDTIQCYPNSTKVYLYEIENEKEPGKLVGEAYILDIYELHYNDNSKPSNTLVEKRYFAIKQLYLDWCTVNSIKPNYKEGWFKSKKFITYKDKIGWGGNYALFLDTITRYDEPKEISNILGSLIFY